MSNAELSILAFFLIVAIVILLGFVMYNSPLMQYDEPPEFEDTHAFRNNDLINLYNKKENINADNQKG
ncbi:MAG: hypothetical protein V4493_01135 [Pseudomonadota bacterium]